LRAAGCNPIATGVVDGGPRIDGQIDGESVMRAREPDLSGYVARDGVRIHYESYGDGERTVVFVPDVMVTAEVYKAQVPYLARSHRVVVLDPRGNGLSDRPVGAAAYTDVEQMRDVLAVMDHLDVPSATLVGVCDGGYVGLVTAVRHPDRVDAVVTLGVSAATGTPNPDRGSPAYDDLEATWHAPPRPDLEGWYQRNRALWQSDWPRWPRFFFGEMVNDSHASKIYEDLVGWACLTNGETQVSSHETRLLAETPEETAELLAGVRCPVLVVHGTHDFCQAFGRGADVARLTGAELLVLGGGGHVLMARDPVPVNHAISDFVRRVHEAGAASRREGPTMVRVHLDTRRDAPPLTGTGVRAGRATVYGGGVPTVVVLAPAVGDRAAWQAQVPGVARHASVLVLDDDVSDAAEVRSALAVAGVTGCVVLAPPGSEAQAAELAADREHVSVVVRVEARQALAEQSGLLEFFVHRLPQEPDPASVPLALVGREAAAGTAAPTVVVVDDVAEPTGAVEAVLTVEGGVAPDHVVRRSRAARERRVLFLSSPIGLGHVRRDLAIADALRRDQPGLRVDWLSQSPVTDLLERRGERVHPASVLLARETEHIEAEAGEHDLHAFQAIRRMDEILVHNFHVFDDLVREQEYDAWIGDEAWDLDHFLHENPRLKRAPFIWLTDFVGWVPMPDGGAHEAALTADYNAEMVEHLARHPGLRDRSVFVGDPEDVVPGSLGPGLPDIRAWTEEHFAFSGYVMGERPDPAARDDLRARLGYGADETVCVVSAGGSGVGEALLRRIVEAYDACLERVPSLRMHVVTGPRLDPESVKAPDGVTVQGFVPDLDLHHAACDVAMVQGGLSTTMELTAADRPFLYFPLRHHFEQQVHVRHRLERHGAGRALDYQQADPATIAEALVAELARPRAYRSVPTDGAARAARLVAEAF